ncbi:MAG: NUDIX domain-containing protein [Phycisphaerae bacterium]|nr:NUDIX domain-containing protein [Phycisphaerae bacterium]
MSYLQEMRALVGSRPLLLPGVRAVVPDAEGRILLQRRTDMPRWSLPAGSVEIGETAAEALRREVREETSLAVIDAEPMALYSGPDQAFVYPNGDRVACFSMAFVVRRWSGDPAADGVEGSAVRFFALDALPEDIVDIHRRTLDDYRRYNGTFFLA